MARTKTQKFLRYGIFGVGLMIGLGLLSYILIIRPLQIHNQKLQFQKAEASLDVLAAQAQSFTGDTKTSANYNYCQYTSQESGKGPRSCVVSRYLLYSVPDYEHANEIMNKAAKISKASLVSLYTKKRSVFVSEDSSRLQGFSQDLALNNGLSCNAQYAYPAQNFSPSPFKISAKETLLLILSCSDGAQAELYPTRS